MTDTDHNRSNNGGTGAKALDRDDDGIPTPSQSGASGGDLAREIGQRDEEKTIFGDSGPGRDPQVTSVHKGDKANEGDEPNLPNRTGGGDTSGHVPPRRTS